MDLGELVLLLVVLRHLSPVLFRGLFFYRPGNCYEGDFVNDREEGFGIFR